MTESRRPNKAGRVGRKCRIAGWTLIVPGLLLAAVWAWSGLTWRTILRTNSSEALQTYVHAGRLVVECSTSSERTAHEVVELRLSRDVKERLISWRRPGWAIDYAPLEIERTDTITRRGVNVTVALWPVALLFLLSGASFIYSAGRARWRTRVAACVSCGYPRAGLEPGAVCPECGNANG